jgi:hypothetical protein
MELIVAQRGLRAASRCDLAPHPEGKIMITGLILATSMVVTPIQYIRPDLGNPYTIPQMQQQQQRQREQQYMNDMAAYQRQRNELLQQQLDSQRHYENQMMQQRLWDQMNRR